MQYGVEISRTTLGNWIIDCAEKYFLPLYEYFHREFLKRRYDWRLKKEKSVIDAFFAWLDAQHPDRGMRMPKAVNYALNRKPYLATYLEDGRCSFSNNLSENAIRSFTVGRKNWLFSYTPDGATASSDHTIVEMAKAHDMNVYRYLCYLLTKRPDKHWSDTSLSKLAPWDPDVMEVCRNDRQKN